LKRDGLRPIICRQGQAGPGHERRRVVERRHIDCERLGRRAVLAVAGRAPVAVEQQGRGLGRRLVQLLADEAQRRGKQWLIVGTANSSIGNIVFYQKCGLRMDHIRHDYFGYERHPVFENGILKRDLLVFRLDLREEDGRLPSKRSH
jgi:GNAT superfamily N-acetyltransferase